MTRAAEFVRFQPRGASIFNHTSDTSDDPLPTGFVFAYENLGEVFGDWTPFGHDWSVDLQDTEVVTFTGAESYDPGDWEGVAVRPLSVLRTETPQQWLERMVRDDPEVSDAALDALSRRVL